MPSYVQHYCSLCELRANFFKALLSCTSVCNPLGTEWTFYVYQCRFSSSQLMIISDLIKHQISLYFTDPRNYISSALWHCRKPWMCTSRCEPFQRNLFTNCVTLTVFMSDFLDDTEKNTISLSGYWCCSCWVTVTLMTSWNNGRMALLVVFCQNVWLKKKLWDFRTVHYSMFPLQ